MTTVATDIAHEEEYLGKLDWRLWTKILRRAMAYRTSIVLLLVTAAVMAGVDALYPLVTRGLIDDIEAGRTTLPRWIMMYAALAVVSCSMVAVFIHCGGKIATHVSHDIRAAGFDKLQEPAVFLLR